MYKNSNIWFFRQNIQDIRRKKAQTSEFEHQKNVTCTMKDPEQFNPDRFLDNKGNYVRNERVIPFGIGGLVCYQISYNNKNFKPIKLQCLHILTALVCLFMLCIMCNFHNMILWMYNMNFGQDLMDIL